MRIAVLSSFTTSLFWFRVDMMQSFQRAGYEVLAVGDGDEAEWADRFAGLGIRYRQIPVQRNGTNPISDLKTMKALNRLLKEEKPDKIFAYQAKTVIYGGIAARLNGIREFYPLIAGVGSVFLGDSPKQKLIRSILVGPFDTNPSAIKPEELQPYIDDGSMEYVGEQKDVQPYLRACTAYVLPSYHEGTPKTVLEAMACGRPAITTDAPGCRETVTDGVNGFLVPVKDVDAIVDSMEKILDEPENTAAMATAARQMAEDVFDVHKVNLKIRQTMGIGD